MDRNRDQGVRVMIRRSATSNRLAGVNTADSQKRLLAGTALPGGAILLELRRSRA